MAYNQRTYTESDATKRWRKQMENHAATKPVEYTSQWTAQRDDALGAITNRDPFSYDVNGDAMWHQYKDRYTTMGKQAMADTMGQAAALTGGYGNSQAQIAGQQVYQGYMQGLADKIPELAQHALDRYNQETQNLYDRYNLYNNQEQSDYARYQDQYQQWQADRDYYANQYNTERGYDYNVYRDNVSDDQWKANFDEDTRRWNYQNQKKNSSGGSGGGGGDDYVLTDDFKDYVDTNVKGGTTSIAAAALAAQNRYKDIVKDYKGLVNSYGNK